MAVYRTGEKYNVKTTDKTEIEHKGLIRRHTITKLDNQVNGNIAWKKVDWKKVEKEMEEMGRLKVEERWNKMKEMMNGMERVRMGKRKAEWWDNELEKRAKDLKSMRRTRNEGWSVCGNFFSKYTNQEKVRIDEGQIGKNKIPSDVRNDKTAGRKKMVTAEE